MYISKLKMKHTYYFHNHMPEWNILGSDRKAINMRDDERVESQHTC